MIKPKKNPVTKIIGVGVKAAAKVSASAAQKKIYKEKVTTPAKKVVQAAKTEAKANARGLKAARGKLSKGNAKREYDKDKIEMIMKYNPGDSKADAIRWSSHPGHASQKSNARLQKGKWSSEKQIARYQKSEIKDFRKPKKKSK